MIMRRCYSAALLILVMAIGCGRGTPRQATEGADPEAIAEYEAAVAAMEEQMAETVANDPTDTQE